MDTNSTFLGFKSQDQVAEQERTFMNKTLGWMSLGLLFTALSAWYVAGSEQLLNLFYGNSAVFLFVILAELGLVIYLSARIQKMTYQSAILGFLGYSLLNGITLASILLIYTSASVFGTFLVTAGVFGATALYGATTKKNLASLGGLMFMLLFGLIIGSIVNIFFFSETIYWLLTYAGIAIFVGLTAYDMQVIKHYAHISDDTEESGKMSIIGALKIYLDFINLFLFILRILGSRRD